MFLIPLIYFAVPAENFEPARFELILLYHEEHGNKHWPGGNFHKYETFQNNSTAGMKWEKKWSEFGLHT